MRWAWFNQSLVTANQDGSIPLNAKCIMCRIPNTFSLEYPNETNARLIAAAPELLEALNSIFLKCSFKHVTDWQEFRREIGEMAGQAIAKTEGQDE